MGSGKLEMNRSMKVYFIRHGATKGNQEHRYVGRTNETILDTEWNCLREKGEVLEKMDCIFSSPYLRCIQSAQALFNIKEQEIELIEDLQELDFGAFEYKNYQELNGNSDYQKYIDSGGTISFPDGEEPELFKSRCRKAFEHCMNMAWEQKWNQIAFVVHGGTIMAILEEYGIPKRSFFDYQVPNGSGFVGEVTGRKYISMPKKIK